MDWNQSTMYEAKSTLHPRSAATHVQFRRVL